MALSQLGPYRVTGVLKAGGEGQVYAAEDERLGRRVALKYRYLPAAGQPRQVVLAEARLLAALNHPNIVRLYDIVETGDGVALVMEFFEGRDLEELMAVSPLDLEPVLQVGLELCSALGEAHGRNVVHGDIKAANVLVDGSGRVKLADFGMGFSPGDSGRRGGTPSLLSPEQRAGLPGDARSDLWGLGCLMYRLLHDCLPESMPLDAVEEESSGRIEVPPALDALVSGLLEPDPARRPSSALQVRQALLKIARDFPSAQGATLAQWVLPTIGAANDDAPVKNFETVPDGDPGQQHAKPDRQSPSSLWKRVTLALVALLALTVLVAANTLLRDPPAIEVQVMATVFEGSAAGVVPEDLQLRLVDAVERHPGLTPVQRDGGGVELHLSIRCGEQLCTSQLIMKDSGYRATDTRTLLADLPVQTWDDRLDEGLRALFP